MKAAQKNQSKTTGEKMTFRRGTKTYKEVLQAMKVLKEELEKISLHPSQKDELRVL